MNYRFCVHPFKFAVSLFCCALFAALCVSLLLIHRWGSAAVFLLLSLLFGFVSALCGAVVRIGQDGIIRTVLGFGTKVLRWENIAEVGVTGTKVFNRQHPDRTGSLYIYFSEAPMTEEERFDMMLKWPPMDKIYLLYNKQRMEAVQLLWDRKVAAYNVGNLAL